MSYCTVCVQGTDSPTQRGVIHNLLALCLRRQCRVPEAGWHLHSALVISRESGNQRNQALALANLGCLALDVGASWIAKRFLVRSDMFYCRVLNRLRGSGETLTHSDLNVSPDLCTFSLSFGETRLTRSTFRPTSGWGGATKTGGGVRTSEHVMKWDY